MPLLHERDRKVVRDKLLAGLVNPVKMVVFTQEFECQYCADVRMLAEELAELADGRLKLTVYDFEKDSEAADRYRVDKIPALLLHGEKEYGVRFFGIPSGYEFATLLEDIINVSRGVTRLSESTKAKLRAIKEPVHIQVFVTPTCPYCP
jgi:glutaredoxin-like protein